MRMLYLPLCGLPITITIAGKWLNSLIFHDNNKRNGQMIITVSANKIYYMMIIHFCTIFC